MNPSGSTLSGHTSDPNRHRSQSPATVTGKTTTPSADACRAATGPNRRSDRPALSRQPARPEHHSHSIVPGGLLVMSNTTRLIPFTSLVIRVEIRSNSS